MLIYNQSASLLQGNRVVRIRLVSGNVNRQQTPEFIKNTLLIQIITYPKLKPRRQGVKKQTHLKTTALPLQALWAADILCFCLMKYRKISVDSELNSNKRHPHYFTSIKLQRAT